MSSPTVLPASALTPLRIGGASRFVQLGLVRAALYLVPVALASAASESLATLPWPVPVGALATAWVALPVLVYVGRQVTSSADPATAARVILLGYAMAAVVWAAWLLLGPTTLTGPGWWSASLVSAAALGYGAALAVALATGAERALLRWCLPALVVAVLLRLDWPPAAGWLAPVLLLSTAAPLGWAAAAGWSGRWAAAPTGPGRARPASVPAPAGPVRGLPDLRRGLALLLLGMGQAAVVIMAWRASPAPAGGGVPPTLAPLLVSAPLVEIWVGWHLLRHHTGRAWFADHPAHQRYLHRLGWRTVGALWPPLIVTAALAVMAHRLPYRLSGHPDAPAMVLALATGVLLAGVVAIGALLAGRGRPGLAALLALAPALAALGLASWAPWQPAGSLAEFAPLLAAAALTLAVGYGAGLVALMQVLFARRPGGLDR